MPCPDLWNDLLADMKTDLISCVRPSEEKKIEYVDIFEFYSSIIFLNVS